MFCAISGKPPLTPVVSPVSKCVFEKNLIEQYIQETGNDPVNNAPLSADQLIVISKAPQQYAFANAVNSSTLNSNYSIPNLLSTLQNEWDAIMLENFRLRKQLDAFTKQLSTALYERDAAKVVASNALREKEQLAQELNRLSLTVGMTKGEKEEPSQEREDAIEEKKEGIEEKEKQEKPHDQCTGLSEGRIKEILDYSKEYVNNTKKKKDIFTVIAESGLAFRNTYNAVHSPLLQSGSKLLPDLTKFVIFTTYKNNKIYIVQGDKTSEFEIDIEDKLKYLTLTPKKDYLLFSTNNRKIGTYNIGESQSNILEVHSDEIILMQTHEYIFNNQFLWVDKKGKIGLSSLDCSNTTLISQGGAENFSRAALHKDGILLALLQRDRIQVYDLTRFEEGPTVWQVGKEITQEGPITGVEFCSNGYWMIVSTVHAIMSFDLRKSIGTLAVQPLSIDCQIWDCDLSGKHLVIWQSGKLRFYNFVKAIKMWKLNKEYPMSQSEDDGSKSLKLSYDESGSVIVLQTSNEIQIFGINVVV